MSVVSITKKWEGRRGSWGEKNKVELAALYGVTTDDPEDDADVVKAALELNVGEEHEKFPGVRIKTITADPNGDPLHWLVTVQYSSAVDEEEQDENPLARPTEISIDFEQFQRPAEKGINKDDELTAILNSAGEAFESAVEIDDSRPVLVFTRNELLPNFALWAGYRDAVNSDAFMGHPPNTCKLGRIRARRRIEGDFEFYEVTYEVHINPDNWSKKILDQGHYYLVDLISFVDKVPFKDKEGQPILGLLNGEGGKLEEGKEPVFVEYKVYKLLPFAALRLP